jgi:hypothetical protein
MITTVDNIPAGILQLINPLYIRYAAPNNNAKAEVSPKEPPVLPMNKFHNRTI